MDEYTADAFTSEHEEPTSEPLARTTTESTDQRDAVEGSVKSSKSGDVEDHGDLNLSLQDRLLAKLLQQMIPADDRNDNNTDTADKPVDRPPFSLPTMANNFRRFNARIGPVFDFQESVGRLLSWKKPTQTLSFLAIYSFVCLNPYLLAVLPLASVLFFIMVPAFLARHPPPPTSSSGSSSDYSYEGPALAPAKTIKPASETSKDFFQNMRDLQNTMADFSDLHDFLVKTLAPPTNFSDEKRSSEIFILLTAVTASLFLVAHMLPWRAIFLIGGNFFVLSNHPGVQRFLEIADGDKDSDAKKTEQKSKASKDQSNPLEAFASPIGPIVESLTNISLDSTLEEREVEIFELQRRSTSPHAFNEWETVLFSPNPYDPLSPSRIAGDRPRGCRHFEDVQPPPGWAWKSKKWELDIECRQWVMERMITGVGYEIPGVSDISSDGPEDHIGGWVWDLPPDGDHASAYEGASDIGSIRSFKSDKIRGKANDFPVVDWEESSQFQGAGEWRRRRWVRTVHRTSVTNDKNAREDPGRD